MDDPKWTANSEHDRLYVVSVDLTQRLQEEFGCPDLRVQCGFEERVGFHFRVHGVAHELLGKVSDRARDWLAATTPFRFEVHTEEV